MNAPDLILTAQIGEAEVRVPREAAVMAYLEQEIDRGRPLTVLTAQAAERLDDAYAERMARAIADAPAIGAEYEGGVYAGLTLRENAPHRLVLLPGELEAADWVRSMEWAAKQGWKKFAEDQRATLPFRIDQLVLWQNLRAHFQPAAYWSCEEYASGAEYAWGQAFGLGTQACWHKSDEYRARAVRSIPI